MPRTLHLLPLGLALVALLTGCAGLQPSRDPYDSVEIYGCNEVTLSKIERSGNGYAFTLTTRCPSDINGRAGCFPHLGSCDHEKTDAAVTALRLERFGDCEYRVTVDSVRDGQYVFINVSPSCDCASPLLFQQRNGRLYYKLWEFQCSDEHDAPVALN